MGRSSLGVQWPPMLVVAAPVPRMCIQPENEEGASRQCTALSCACGVLSSAPVKPSSLLLVVMMMRVTPVGGAYDDKTGFLCLNPWPVTSSLPGPSAATPLLKLGSPRPMNNKGTCTLSI